MNTTAFIQILRNSKPKTTQIYTEVSSSPSFLMSRSNRDLKSWRVKLLKLHLTPIYKILLSSTYLYLICIKCDKQDFIIYYSNHMVCVYKDNMPEIWLKPTLFVLVRPSIRTIWQKFSSKNIKNSPLFHKNMGEEQKKKVFTIFSQKYFFIVKNWPPKLWLMFSALHRYFWNF